MAGVTDKEAEETGPSTNQAWIDAYRNKTQTPGNFLLAGPVTETILLGAISLRARKRVEYDSATYENHKRSGSKSIPDTGISARMGNLTSYDIIRLPDN